MARNSAPNWTVENPTTKPNEYSSQFVFGGSRYVNVTDVSTGQRWLYSTGIGGSRTLISSTNANGNVTKGPGYTAVSSNYETLNKANKNQSEAIITRVSTIEEKAEIGKGSEYRSKFGPQAGGTRDVVPQIGEADNNPPDTKNPIISIGEVCKYPIDMHATQDRIVFTAVEIRTRKDITQRAGTVETGVIEDNLSAFTLGDPDYMQVGGHVMLPLQAPIQDQNGVDWSSDSISAVDALLYNSAVALIETAGENPESAKKSLDNTLNQGLKGLETNVGKLQRMFAGQAAGVNNILSRTDGSVLNPNLELIFQGPQLRAFSFTFKLSARSPEEAKIILKIIKYFKRHMAVRKKEGIFLKAPHVFTIVYQKGISNNPIIGIGQTIISHPGIGIISPSYTKRACALTNMSTDYTPLGSYMTFEEQSLNDPKGVMVSYTISLQFQDIQPIYDVDYDGDHPIGY